MSLGTNSSEAKAHTCTYDTFGQTAKAICEANGGRFQQFKPTPNSVSTGRCTLPEPGINAPGFFVRRGKNCLGPHTP